ncbi:hypothetical protein MRX96_012377 [Rhipicephalus microplus]
MGSTLPVCRPTSQRSQNLLPQLVKTSWYSARRTVLPTCLDAYCPHLGAHLGVMGRVVGDCIVCPFHGWKFQGDTGACTHVPYASKLPTFAKVKTWTSLEKYGLIFIWYHAEEEQPEWSIDDFTELSSGDIQTDGAPRDQKPGPRGGHSRERGRHRTPELCPQGLVAAVRPNSTRVRRPSPTPG